MLITRTGGFPEREFDVVRKRLHTTEKQEGNACTLLRVVVEAFAFHRNPELLGFGEQILFGGGHANHRLFRNISHGVAARVRQQDAMNGRHRLGRGVNGGVRAYCHTVHGPGFKADLGS